MKLCNVNRLSQIKKIKWFQFKLGLKLFETASNSLEQFQFWFWKI